MICAYILLHCPILPNLLRIFCCCCTELYLTEDLEISSEYVFVRMSFISGKRSFQNRNIVLLTFNFYSKCTLLGRKDGQLRKAFSLSFLLIPPLFFWHDRTKTKAEAFTFKKPQQERAQETFEASSSPSPTNWWAKNARGDDVLTESTTHREEKGYNRSVVSVDIIMSTSIHNWKVSVLSRVTAPNVCGLAILLLLCSRNFSE